MRVSTAKRVDPAIIPTNEEQRIAALRRYDILDTPPDGTFDGITKLISDLLNVPIAIVSLVDTDRIWFKSHHGVEVTEIERDPGLCASCILKDEAYVLADALVDPRSLANPLVAGEFGLRFYAGIPLKTRDGFNLGTVCALDFAPRTLSANDLQLLERMAELVMDQMELRLAARRLDAANRELLETHEKLQMAVQAGSVGVWEMQTVDGRFIWNSVMSRIYGIEDAEFTPTTEEWNKRLHPGDAVRVMREWRLALLEKRAFISQFRIMRPSGETRHICCYAKFVPEGDDAKAMGVNIDITDQYNAITSRMKRQASFVASRKAPQRRIAPEYPMSDIPEI